MKKLLGIVFVINALVGCGSGSSSSSSDDGSLNEISGELVKSITEDATEVVTGQLLLNDKRHESGFEEQQDVSTKYGSFSLSKSGEWSYRLNPQNTTVQSLQLNEEIAEKISVSSIEDTSASVTINITGENDAATFTSGDNIDFLVIEKNTTATVQYSISVSDADSNENSIIPQTNKQGLYGVFNISEGGVWSYQINAVSELANLTYPDKLTDIFIISSVDETKHTVTVEIFAAEDLTVEPEPEPAPKLKTNELGIELNDWYLSVPTDTDGNGRSDSIGETELSNGYSDEFFFVSDDNGLVFRCPPTGYKTSNNTKYVRVELREMLRRGDKSIKTQGVNLNNWVFSSAPSSDLNSAGGIDGKMTATLAVNSVTTTGEAYQIGRVVIGQIHANDDEPIRLYYRKLPGNTKGSVYFAHEPIGESDDYYELVGSRDNDASDPANGIALDEKFSYEIETDGNLLTVVLKRDNKPDITRTVDMKDSGYDQGDQYMYFKAGVYNGNNSAQPDEMTQATFYELKNSHSGYSFNEH